MRRLRLIPTLILVCGGVLAAPPPPQPLPSGLLVHKPTSLLPDDRAGSMKFRDLTGASPPPVAVWSAGSGAGDAVLRVENFARPKAADDVLVRWPFRQSAKRGDVVLIRFFARAEYARQESGEAAFELTVKQDLPSYAAHVKLPLSAGPEWVLLEIPFVMQRDAGPTEGTIQFSFGAIPQAVEIARLEALNFGPAVKPSELPQTRFTYQGREAGAAWREAALERIETLRTAPLAIRVIDAAGTPIPEARVEVRLTRPDFLFGTSVDSSFLLGDTPDAAKYREKLLEFFDTAVIENGMKWPVWSGSPERRAEALRAADWLESQGLRMRGHCLVWPGDKFSPKRVAAMPPPRAELPLLIRERIRDILTATRGRIVGWDVINEMLHERDYFKTMPETEAAEWFRVAREADPRAKLFINEYGMLNGRNSPAKIADYVALVGRLREAGAPIDAMGIQGHIGRQVRNPGDVLADLDRLAAPGLELQITEFDINSADEELQADYTRDFLIALYSHPAVTGFTMWGFWEKKHWKPDGAMFRADWSEKPNAKVWRDWVRTRWLTRATLETGPDGRVTTRGHLGDYEFSVAAGGRTLVQTRALTRSGADITLQFP